MAVVNAFGVFVCEVVKLFDVTLVWVIDKVCISTFFVVVLFQAFCG